jgi:hypothetical protein
MKNFNPEEYKKACDSAIMSYTMAYLIFKRIPVKKLIVITCMLFICMVSFSQNFKEIDFRGKTSSEVPKLCCDGQFIAGPHNWVNKKGEEDPNGEEVMVFRGYDFQNVWFQFNKKGICYKIIIRNNVSKPPIIFDKSIIYKVNWENGVIVYTIEK